MIPYPYFCVDFLEVLETVHVYLYCHNHRLIISL